MAFGHPKGLFPLFFIEMWERLAFYTMVGVLFLYAIDRSSGGLGLPRSQGAEIYGLYLAFVYFTPYLGGLLADRFLGFRRAVLIGGVFFATGFFLLGSGQQWTFVAGLVCLIVGNGFFKPNISAMVGNLYQPGDPKRDTGFSIFYMGINIGAFIAPFLAATMRNRFFWEATFLAAGVGMLIGISILLVFWRTLAHADPRPGAGPEDTPFGEIMLKIIGPAAVVGLVGWFVADRWLPSGITKLVKPTDIGFLVGAIPIIVFFVNLARRAGPEEKPGLAALLPIYVAGGTFFMVLHLNGSAMTAWAADNTDRESETVAEVLPDFAGKAYPGYYHNAADDVPRPDRSTLLPIADPTQANMFGQKRMDDETLAALQAKLPEDVKVLEIPARDRTEEQARWVPFAVEIYDRVDVKETAAAHGGTEITVSVADDASPLKQVAFVRAAGDDRFATYLVTPETFGDLYQASPPELPPGQFLRTANPELYQSLNPFFVVALTPLIVWLFQLLRRKHIDFSTARKIVTGMVVTAIALGLMALAGFVTGDGAQKASWWWLVGFYGIVTVGELLLSPMALSLVTKLSPKRFAGLTMGGWFFATAVGNKFSGFLGGLQAKLPPTEFFLLIVGAVLLVAFGLFLLLPRLDAAIKKYGA